MTGKEAQAQADRVSSVFKVEEFKDVPHFAAKLAIESALREFDSLHRHSAEYFFQNDVS